VGPRIDDPVSLDLPEAQLTGGRIRGQVIYADRFGNLVTNVPVDLLYKRPGKGTPKIHLAGRVLTGLHLTYAEKEPGQPLALIGSLDFLEIAVNQGRADKHFGVAEGEPVEVEL
jgi:S-adenosylmethionine hydrolase